jgi:hypothetical protein
MNTFGLLFWAATASLTCRLWRTEERAHRSAIKLDNCLRVASLGRLGAMLGKLPSLIHSWWME